MAHSEYSKEQNTPERQIEKLNIGTRLQPIDEMSYDESKEDTSVGGGKLSKAGIENISMGSAQFMQDNENFCGGSVQSMSDGKYSEDDNGSNSSPSVCVKNLNSGKFNKYYKTKRDLRISNFTEDQIKIKYSTEHD